MADIEFRYRDYKDPRKRGTWILIGGRQYQKVSNGHLTQQQMDAIRENFIRQQKGIILRENGFTQVSESVYRDKIDDDTIIEVKFGDLNDEIADVQKDPNTGKWKKEKTDDRQYVDSDKVDDLEKKVT